jgi:cation:H+ antiporter
MSIAAWPLSVHGIIFAVAALLVAVVGTRLAGTAAELARRTGMGQAVTGALFLGASTSLSGIVTSVSAAAGGHAELAASNAIGGIAAQTVFLAIADRFYHKANLEHAAASDENMLQGALLIGLLSLVLMAAFAPQATIFAVHPVSAAILVAYIFGQRLVIVAKGQEMRQPRITEHTQREKGQGADESGSGRERSIAVTWATFIGAAVLVGVGGYFLAQSGIAIAERTGLNETVLGGLFTAVSTSFPELVTVIAAVRMGALTLAVSDIMGGNAFDVIFLAVADIAYRDGSLYHGMGPRPTFLVMLTILLTSILLMGLIRRERHGIANIGFESFLLLVIYAGGFAIIVTTMG